MLAIPAQRDIADLVQSRPADQGRARPGNDLTLRPTLDPVNQVTFQIA
jgi:hypothetical protein